MNPRRIHELMRKHFPETDRAALEWINVLERDGTVRRDVLGALIDKFVNAENLLVEVSRKIGDALSRHDVISYVEKYVGQGRIRIADRDFQGYVLVAMNGVAAGWITSEVRAVKDPENERPIPSAWRRVLAQIVEAFARHDYRLGEGLPGVAPVSEKTAKQIQAYVEDYDATLVRLPEHAWQTSVCIWMGDHWDAMVDLWTEEEGASDLVLRAHVAEDGDAYLVTVRMVYVP